MSNKVLGTNMLLKPSKKERNACPGIVPFNDNVKGTEELLRQSHKEREGWLIDYNQWDRSRSPLAFHYVYLISSLWSPEVDW